MQFCPITRDIFVTPICGGKKYDNEFFFGKKDAKKIKDLNKARRTLGNREKKAQSGRFYPNLTYNSQSQWKKNQAKRLTSDRKGVTPKPQ